jgi:transposase
LSDDQFARIEHLLPGRPGYVGRNSDEGNRLFVEAVIWKFRTGAPWLEVRRIKPVIPPRTNRKTPRECDFALYCERNLVERFFNIIKHLRAIAPRYEKTARNLLAGVHLVCALAWLK